MSELSQQYLTKQQAVEKYTFLTTNRHSARELKNFLISVAV